ncbi:MAG: ParB/RepB/Spo0J family partition protein [Alphaproteobacteria bacterium]|nr:ParB/RepB/Spo0J family partition protein [Alphaproteobacteria bacterium]
MAKVKYKPLSSELKKLTEPSSVNASRSSIGMDQDVGEFYYFSLEKLVPYSKQVRVVFDDEEITSLAQTIKDYGVRQPLTIISSASNNGTYEIISGERRYRAAKVAGLEKVPCIIIKDREKAEEIALVENIQRADLHPIELGNAYKSLLPTIGEGSQRVLAKRLGISHTSISENMALTTLPEVIINKLLNDNIRNRQILRSLVKSESLEKMHKILGISNIDENTFEKLTTSVLRISLNNGSFKIQKKPIEKLNEQQKANLKIQLMEIIDSL